MIVVCAQAQVDRATSVQPAATGGAVSQVGTNGDSGTGGGGGNKADCSVVIKCGRRREPAAAAPCLQISL